VSESTNPVFTRAYRPLRYTTGFAALTVTAVPGRTPASTTGRPSTRITGLGPVRHARPSENAMTPDGSSIRATVPVMGLAVTAGAVVNAVTAAGAAPTAELDRRGTTM
jgi:hypothetical protein